MPSVSLGVLVRTLELSRDRFVFGLEKVPEERLNWAPVEGIKTPLALAGTVVLFTSFLAAMLTRTPIEGGARPPVPTYENREEAVKAVEAGFNRLREALSGLSDEDLQATTMTPWGQEVSISAVATWTATVPGYLQGQLNYIQTAYGDLEPNIPPSWAE